METQIARMQSNPRVRELLPVVIGVLVELAEHSSHGEFAERIGDLIAQLDQDGAVDDLRTRLVEQRLRDLVATRT